MAVNHEIKSQLAKLLATEDLVVEHKQVETAQFNVHTRVLTLPVWEKASNNVYDSLVAHEVGHALFTPDVDWTETHKIPQQFVNIVEDARIEKLMRRKYAGIAKTFYRGYNELHDQDFFEVNNEDIDTLNLADRVNLYFKIGNFINISFSDAEKKIVSLVENCETFEEVLDASKVLYNYCKQQQEADAEEEVEANIEMQPTQGGGTSLDNSEKTEEKEEVDLDHQPESSEQGFDGDQESDSTNTGSPEKPTSTGTRGSDTSEPEVKTADALENAIKDLVGQSGRENAYVEIPKLKLEDILIPNKNIHDECQQCWDEYLLSDSGKIYENDDEINQEELNAKYYRYMPVNGIKAVDREFEKFKKSAQKEVNYLVKEFECKKSASAYARATVAKTGVLDTSKLHTYKYNEDLFKKVTVIPEGKNHGLIFILDWSGSMSDVMIDTLKQLYNLLWFCKKVNIPFDVYAFSNNHPGNVTGDMKQYAYEPKEGSLEVCRWFSLMNMFTSSVNGKTLDQQMKNIFRVAYAFRNNVRYHCPQSLSLSGTPLNESLIALHQIIPQFKDKNKVEKVQCVILTDGEAYPLRYHREVQRDWEDEPYLGTNETGDHTFLRDRKTGKTYKLSWNYHESTDVYLKNLRDTFPNSNFIGIRIMSSRDAGSFMRRYCQHGKEYDTIQKRWRKEKCFSIKNSGYHTYFGLSSNDLSNDDEFEVKDDASKAEIKRAFIKSLKTKKLNKKILGEFVELVA